MAPMFMRDLIGRDRFGRDPIFCAMAITPAVDPFFGICMEFRSSCVALSGWRKVHRCPSAIKTIKELIGR